MAHLTVDVKPAVLTWVLQKAINLNFDNEIIELVEKWRSGEKTPTFHQLETFSRKTGIPFGYFFLDTPPGENCELAEFRTIDGASVMNPSRALIDTLDTMRAVQDWMADYNRENGLDRCAYVGRMTAEDSASRIAEDIRKELNLPLDWFAAYRNADIAFRALREKIGKLGILVMVNGVVGNNTHRKLSLEEFRAFTLIDSYAPLIFINSVDTANGKLFSLFHELAHVWIGRESLYNDRYGILNGRNREEQLCNAVAADILVPDQLFCSRWDEAEEMPAEIIDRLGRYFVCSHFVLARKALDQGKIEKKEYNRLVADYTSQSQRLLQGKTQSGGGDFYRTLKSKWDPNFIRALSGSVESGRTQYRDAYLLTQTNGKTFTALAENVGGYEIG